MNLIFFQTAGINLLLGFIPETLGLLLFGIGLIVFAAGLRWILSRGVENNGEDLAANIHRTS